MKVSEVIKNLQDIQDKYGDLKCIYSRDEEGNGYCSVNCPPNIYAEIKDSYGVDYYSLPVDDEVCDSVVQYVICIN